MLTLHTSDWHLGRALHGFDLGDAQAAFADHLVDAVRSERVGLVLVSGDVHDRAIPPVAAMRLFDETLSRLRDAGAHVVVISGNHDAPHRLGDKAGLLDPRVRIRTRPAAAGEPVVVDDEHGQLRIYPIPYLDPVSAAAQLPDLAPAVGGRVGSEPPPGVAPGSQHREDGAGGEADASGGGGNGPAGGAPGAGGADRDGTTRLSHAATMRRAMAAVRADLGRHGGRSIVCAHAWVTGAAGSDSERDISVGGLASVPAGLFDGITYTALGHLHRPQALRDGLRYSGSPLAYSFSEAGDVKSSLLVEIGAGGLGTVETVPVPVPRRLTALRGHLSELLSSAEFAAAEADFVSVVLTDPARPLDAMARLQRRFPYTLALAHEPSSGRPDDGLTFGQRVRGRSELAVAEEFVAYVRDDPSERERALLAGALEAARRDEEAA